MADNEIINTLRIVGLDAVAQTLASLGTVGAAAFQKLQQTSATVAPAFTAVGNAIARVRAQLPSLADTAERVAHRFGASIRQMATSLSTLSSQLMRATALVGGGALLGGGGLVAGLMGFATAGNLSAENLGDLAEQIGETAENTSLLTSVFAESGVSAENLSSAFRRLAVRVTNDFAEIQKASRESAEKIIANNLAITTSQSNLANARRAYALLASKHANEEVSDALAVESASLSLYEAKRKLNDFRGIPRDRDADKRHEEAKLELAVSEAQHRLDVASEQQQQRAAQQQAERRQAALAVQRAEVELAAARRKAREDEANDINTLIEYTNRLASGASTAGMNVNKSVENIVKGIVATAGQGVKGLDNITSGIVGIASAPPKVVPVLMRLADVLKGIPDEATRMAVAVGLLGRGVSVDFVNALARGSGALRAQQEELRRTGLAYSETDVATADAFKRARSALTDTATIIRDKLAVAFGPVMTRVFTALRESMVSNFGTMDQALKQFIDRVEPAVQALINVLKGVSMPKFAEGKDLNDPFVQATLEWQATLEGFKTSVKGIWTEVVNFFTIKNTDGLTGFQQALEGINVVLDKIATGFTFLTGVKVSGEQMGILLLLGQLTGVNGSLVAIGASLATMVASFVTLGVLVVASIGAIPLAIAAIGVAIGFLIATGIFLLIDNWDKVKQAAIDANTAAQDYAKQAYMAATGASAAHYAAVSADWNKIKQIATDANRAVQDYAEQAYMAATAASARHYAESAAHWELIKNKATEMLDAIVNWAATLPARIGAAIASIVQILVAPFDAAAQAIIQIWQGVLNFINGVKALASSSTTPPAATSSDGGGGGWAYGGLIRGPGTGKSDSILARLSNGELVIQADAVAALVRTFGTGIVGALNWFHRHGRLPRFSVGGVVAGMSRSLAVPGFAGGGMVTASASEGRLPPNFGTVQFDLGYGQQFNVMTDQQTADAITRIAVRHRRLRGGVKF